MNSTKNCRLPLGPAFSSYKRFAAKAAKDLKYGKNVINNILNAKTDAEITRILVSARHSQKEE